MYGRLGAHCFLAILGPIWGPNRPSRGPIWDPILEGPEGLNHVYGRLGAHCNYAILGPGRGSNSPSGRPIWDPILGGSRGLNHIDARLGAHCFLAILGPGRGSNSPSGRPILSQPRAGICLVSFASQGITSLQPPREGLNMGSPDGSSGLAMGAGYMGLSLIHI